MKNILVVGKYYPPYNGGIEQVTKMYSDGISSTYNVTVISNSAASLPVGLSDNSGVTVKVLRTNFNVKSQPVALSLPFSFRCSDFDLIHFHAPNPFAASVLWAKIVLERYKGALVVTHHMDVFGRPLLRRLTQPFYEFLTRRADWVSVTSEKNLAVSRDIPADANVVVLPLSIDVGRFDFPESHRANARAWRRAEFGDAPLVGFVGRHARYKGLDVLVRAIAKLDGVHAVIGGEGPLRDQCIQLAEELGVSDRVHFPGSLTSDEKSRLLLAIDVFAFPSTEITEAFGISQLEAMAHGAVVVAGDLPTGVTDVSVDEVTALLARPGDADHLALQIRRVIDDAGLAESLRQQAQRHVRQKFSNDVVLQQYANLVELALSR